MQSKLRKFLLNARLLSGMNSEILCTTRLSPPSPPKSYHRAERGARACGSSAGEKGGVRNRSFMGGHERAADGRVSPNLRSANRPLLDGRAIIHLAIECRNCDGSGYVSCVTENCGTELRGKRPKIGNLRTIGLSELVCFAQYIVHVIVNRHPICYSAFQRGTVISAVLSWSPMSSDCAFILVGCSVSSRYTFP